MSRQTRRAKREAALAHPDYVNARTREDFEKLLKSRHPGVINALRTNPHLPAILRVGGLTKHPAFWDNPTTQLDLMAGTVPVPMLDLAHRLWAYCLTYKGRTPRWPDHLIETVERGWQSLTPKQINFVVATLTARRQADWCLRVQRGLIPIFLSDARRTIVGPLTEEILGRACWLLSHTEAFTFFSARLLVGRGVQITLRTYSQMVPIQEGLAPNSATLCVLAGGRWWGFTYGHVAKNGSIVTAFQELDEGTARAMVSDLPTFPWVLSRPQRRADTLMGRRHNRGKYPGL